LTVCNRRNFFFLGIVYELITVNPRRDQHTLMRLLNRTTLIMSWLLAQQPKQTGHCQSTGRPESRKEDFMSSKKARRKKPAPPSFNKRRKWKIVMLIGIAVGLLLSGVIVARWRLQPLAPSAAVVTPAALPASSPTPNPFVPKRAAKEYIYVGGKLQTIEEPTRPPGGTAFDFTGSAAGEIVVYRPAEGNWYVLDIAAVPPAATLQQLGAGNENLVPGDYDGDGHCDIAIWRPKSLTGTCNGCGWYIKQSSTGAVAYTADWGQGEPNNPLSDVAVPADYNGDGMMDKAVWRPSEGNWYILNSSGTPAQTLIGWGANGDKPVPADYDGDGKADAAVFRPSEGNWYIKKSTGGSTTQNWGLSGDWLAPADYDGDGKADITVWRPSEGNWYIRQSSNNAMKLVNWGAGTDIPVPADYDGDGRIDIAVWRPGDGNWYIKKSSDGTTLIQNWGNSDDIPVPSAYVKH
jgi:hypothetical protein